MSEKSKLSVAEKTAKLNELVAWFDSEEFELEDALGKFSEAEKLADDIDKDLSQLKNTIDIVKTKFSEV